MRSFINNFRNLPFVNIENKEIEERLKDKPIKKIFTDILDDDLWSSKVSLIGNSLIIFLIIISTLEIILETEPSLEKFEPLFVSIYIATSIIFLLELIARIWVAEEINPQHKGFKGKLKFFSNFFNFIDLIAILPFILGIFGIHFLIYLKSIRVLRILKIIRYLPSINLLQRAIVNKKSELIISLQVIFILAILLSIGLYYAESRVENSPFSSVIQAFLWSVAKYIQNIAGYGEFSPVTTIGKFLATLNGVLGIAIFALPAGIIASGFVDEIGEEKKKKEIEEKTTQINRYFNVGYQKKTKINNRKANWRWVTFEELQSRVLLTDDEIFEVIRETGFLRFRPVKSSETIKHNDMKIVERFVKNTSYGCFIKRPRCPIFIFSPLSNNVRHMGHFSYTIADNLDYNYLSLEKRMYTTDNIEIGAGYSEYYENYNENNTSNLPPEFIDMIKDLSSIRKENTLIIFREGASNRAAYEICYGQEVGKDKFDISNSFLNNAEIIKNFDENINFEIANCKENFETPLTVGYNNINFSSKKYIEHLIKKQTMCNIISIHLNVKYLRSDNDVYYSYMNVLMNAIEKTFGNYHNG